MSQSGWQLSSDAPRAYEQYIVAALFDDWARELITATDLRQGERVLDVACGTGIVARHALKAVGPRGTVEAFDVNEGMLAVARSIPANDGVRFQAGDAASAPVSDRSFDVVLCQQGLQYFPDRPAALREMRRALIPGGRVAISLWRPIDRQPYFDALCRAVETYASPETAALQRAAFTLGEPPAIRELLTSAGFSLIRITLAVRLMRAPALLEFLRGYFSATPMAAAIAALDPSAREAMIREIEAALRVYVDDSGLAVPVECNVVTAQIA
jgi:ubiquinone/menaquinone biosynthesis C-methylase UbiE